MFKRKYLVPSDSFRGFSRALLFFVGASFVAAIVSMISESDISLFFQIAFPTVILGLAAFTQKGTGLYKEIDVMAATKAKEKPSARQIGIASAAVVGMIMLGLPIAIWFEMALAKLGYAPGDGGISFALTPLDIFLALILVCALPAFCEELLLRGVVAGGMRRYGKIKASLFSAGLFALLHMNPSQTIHQFLLGFVIAYFFLTTNSLWVAVGMHFLNNLLALALEWFVPETALNAIFINYGYITAIVGLIIVAAAIYALIKFTPDKFDPDEEIKDAFQPLYSPWPRPATAGGIYYGNGPFGYGPYNMDGTPYTGYAPAVQPGMQQNGQQQPPSAQTNLNAPNGAQQTQTVQPFEFLQPQQEQTAQQPQGQQTQRPQEQEAAQQMQNGQTLKNAPPPPRQKISEGDVAILAIGVIVCVAMWLITLIAL